ncbi:MAG: hypothetical protein OXT03_04700 [Alphaproteobacteria bacterium]|nr:hypothetical protein [Alphaproteobacteria bacterium]
MENMGSMENNSKQWEIWKAMGNREAMENGKTEAEILHQKASL